VSSLLSGLPRTREAVSIAPGAVWLKNWLSLEQQIALVERCRALMDGPNGGYVPTVRGGGKMHIRMMCLGRHWNPLTYTYVSTRADRDNAPVAPVPEEWVAMASALARDVGFDCRPDICLINFYGSDGRMGLHQDKDESASSIEAGHPVVSLSIAIPHDSCLAAPDDVSRLRRCCWSQATPSCSAASRACVITACRASFRAARLASSNSTGASISPSGSTERADDLSSEVSRWHS
jgi:alkylated DNA repair dioxygenase AlkB